MREIRFKVLQDGDELHTFNERLMIIKKKNGEYYIYKISGFEDGTPTFDKESILIIKNGIGKIEGYDSESQITILI